jgi:hypothetical protein
MGGNQFTYGVQGRGWSIASGNGETCFWKGRFSYKLELFGYIACRVLSYYPGISAVDCNTAPFGSSILSENVIVREGNVRVFGVLPKPVFRHG